MATNRRSRSLFVLGAALILFFALLVLNSTEAHAPTYNPNNWNTAATQPRNNCYNYASNWQDDSFAQPGRAGGFLPSAKNCNQYTQAAIADGHTQINCNADCASDCHKAALVIWPNVDFHWYRLDANGRWSHKPGMTKATNLDASNNPIVDPQSADRGPYTDFCGCFCACDGKVTKIGPLPTRTSGPTHPDPTATPTPTPTPTPMPTPQQVAVEPMILTHASYAPQGMLQPSLRASLVMYAGILDLNWQISDPDDLATLALSLQNLQPAAPPDWPQFGYRGVVLENHGVGSLPLLIHVFDGVLEIFTVSGSNYFQDTNGLEAWLIQNRRGFFPVVRK